MMKTKRIIAMLLTLVMVLGVVPASVFAEPAAPAPTEALEIVETSEPQLPTEEEATEASEEPTTAVTEATEEVTEATEPVTEATEEVAEEVTEPVVEEPADEIIADEPVQVPSNELLAPMPFAATNTVVTYEKVDEPVAGEKYLIVYNDGAQNHILTYNNAFTDTIGTVTPGTPDTITFEGTTETAVLWHAVQDGTAIYFALNGNKKQYLGAGSNWKNVPTESLIVGTEKRFYVNDAGFLYSHWETAFFGPLYGRYATYDNGWKSVSDSTQPTTPITFYKRVETTNVQLNVEWWLDGEKVSTEGTQVVEAGSTVSLAKPTQLETTSTLYKKVTDSETIINQTQLKTENFTVKPAANTVVKYYFASNPVSMTVNYILDGTVTGESTSYLAPKGITHVIHPLDKYQTGSYKLEKVETNTGATVIDWNIMPAADTVVSVYYKSIPATVTVEWYVRVDQGGTKGVENLYRTDSAVEVTVGGTVDLKKPATLDGLTYYKSSVENGAVLNSNKREPTSVKVNQKGQYTVKVYYSYNLGNAEPVIYPDDTASGLEIPEYPDQGSVRINKTATADNFWGNGIANVELSATGIPVKTGVDVVIIMDASGSMRGKQSVDAQGNKMFDEFGDKVMSYSKQNAAKQATKDLVAKLLAPNEDGTPSSNRVGLVTFAGYNKLMVIDPATGKPKTETIRRETTSGEMKNYEAQLYWKKGYTSKNGNIDKDTTTKFDKDSEGKGIPMEYGREEINRVQFYLSNAGATEAEHTAKLNQLNSIIDNIYTDEGTDYDYAFEEAAEVLKDALPSRQKFVIFMTDGKPTAFTPVGDTKHSLRDIDPTGAEASANKGPALLDENYVRPIFFPNGTNETDAPGKLTAAENMKKNTKKLTVYSVGFDMMSEGGQNDDGTPATYYYSKTYKKGKDYGDYAGKDYKSTLGITGARFATFMGQIASKQENYIDAKNEQELQDTFDKIGTAILKAGTDAFVSDQMGAAYDLQMKRTVPVKGTALEPAPAINVISHKLYTKADVGKTLNGKIIALEDVGKRTGEKTVIETVTFNADGTEAYSNLINGGKTNIKKENGNIIAKNFAYYVVATDLSNGTTAPAESFIWQIGDITTEEIALSYPVYLTGSMEGHRGDGIYDTNEFARIDYTNYKGHEHTEQIFAKPNMPWGSAVVNYEFYLVNKEGEPVNTRGDVIPFEHRVRIGEPQKKSFKLNSGEKIEASLKAIDVVPKGYELHMPDAVYKVIAVSSDDGTQTITGNAGTGYTGNSNHIWKNDPQCINTGVAFGVVNTLTLIPDVVVLDYGKPIAIDVLSNDRVLHNTLYGVCKLGTNTVALGRNLEEGTTAGKTYTGTYGEAAVENDHVLYTLNEFMNGVDKFLYVTKETTTDKNGNTTVAGYRYQEVTVMPATTVYYEDNFNGNTSEQGSNGIVYSGAWNVEGTENKDLQDDGSQYDHPYGYDTSYEKDTALSGGSAHVVQGNAQNPPTAHFSFNGNGFDLIGRTTTDSAPIYVHIYHSTDFDPANGKPLDGKTPVFSKKVNLIYKDGKLDQIPVFHWDADEYGSYTVMVQVGQSVKRDENGVPVKENGKYVYLDCFFYLDAIRIYNPAKGNTEAEEQYKKDNEGFPTFTELRNLLLNQGMSGNAVYVDGNISVTDVAEYKNLGPNNEVYLLPGQVYSVIIQTEKEPVAAFLGAKAPNGKHVEFLIGAADQSPMKYSLDSASDMFYPITSSLDFNPIDQNGTIVYEASLIISVPKVGNEPNSAESPILSLTNLKLTYSESAMAPVAYSNEALVQTTLRSAAFMMSAPVDPEPTVPETTEPEPTVPETTDPEPTETQPTEPEITEPEPTETQPTEPEPTEPNPEKPSNPIKDFFDKIGKWIGGIFG